MNSKSVQAMTAHWKSRPQPEARRPSRGARQFGYLLAVAINLAVLWLVNVAPGWRSLAFLNDDFATVLGLLNLSLVVGVAVNFIYAVTDGSWIKRLGDAASAAFSLMVLLRLVLVFPFVFRQPWAWAEPASRVLLWLAMVGTAIAIVVNLVTLLRPGPGVHRPAATREG